MLFMNLWCKLWVVCKLFQWCDTFQEIDVNLNVEISIFACMLCVEHWVGLEWKYAQKHYGWLAVQRYQCLSCCWPNKYTSQKICNALWPPLDLVWTTDRPARRDVAPMSIIHDYISLASILVFQSDCNQLSL